MTACGGRTLNTSPADDDDGVGGAGDGGSGGVGGLSGVGGSGAMNSGGGGTGAGGPGPGPGSSSSGGPVDCFACLGSNCPDAVGCFTDPDCIQGMICTVTNCMSGGQPDLMCVFDCFDGDIGAALEAIGALTCVFQECQEECGGLIPGP
jgi:hypothetical protein